MTGYLSDWALSDKENSGNSVGGKDCDTNQIYCVGTEPSDDLSLEDFGDSNDVELKVASVFLKLNHIYLVSSVAVDEPLQEFDYLIRTPSVLLIHKTLGQHVVTVR